ncbi:hypothetical protein [Roseibium sp. SCP14]|uniref:hypothetical protein n=1 Tax=Roseibium sp. SCP14 TaxID=3141375 RepID=UPI00333BAD59
MTRSLFMTCAIAAAMTMGVPALPAGLAGPLSASEARADNGEARRAARRTARRTARRVSRRQERYYNSLPGGCVQVIRGGVSYFQCGTVYYQPVVHQGANVFVIVTPQG